MTYTATIKTNSSRDVSHTFHAPSDAVALAEARRVLQETREVCEARLDRLVRHDGTPASVVPLY